MSIHELFTRRSLCRSVREFILSKEGKLLKSVVEMERMKSVNSGECIQVTKTLWRSKNEEKSVNYLYS